MNNIARYRCNLICRSCGKVLGGIYFSEFDPDGDDWVLCYECSKKEEEREDE